MYTNLELKLKHLSCSICKHTFSIPGLSQVRGKIPLLLECGHLICGLCMKTSIPKNCGTCGSISLQNSMEQTHSSANFYVLGLLTANQSNHANFIDADLNFQKPETVQFDESLIKNLEFCSECGLQADFRCRQCDVFFCNSCYMKIHRRALQNHQKVTVIESSKDIYKLLSTQCIIHPNESVQFYCKECEMSACSFCLLNTHQGHCIISQSQKNEELKPELENIIDKLMEMLQRLKQAEKKLSQPLPVLESSLDNESKKEKIEARLVQHFAYLHGVLQNIEDSYMSDLQDRQTSIGLNISAVKEQLKEQKNELENEIKTATAILQENNSNANITAIINELKITLNNMPCHLVQRNTSDSKIDLDIDKSIVESLKTHCALELPPVSCYTLLKTEELPEDYEIQPISHNEVAKPVLRMLRESQLGLSRTSLCKSNSSLSIADQNPNSILTAGANENVKITFIQNPSCFYTQSISRKGELMRLNKSLVKQATIAAIPSQIELNKMYLVNSKINKQWYRGRVVKMHENKKHGQVCDVFAVDYGSTEQSVPLERMRNMSVQNSLIPYMVKKCSLYDVVPSDGVWEKEATEIMKNMIKGTPHTMMHVFEVSNGTYHVDIMKNSIGDGDCPISVRDALIFLEYGCFVTNERLKRINPESLRKFFEGDVSIENMYSVRATHIESPDCIYVQKVDDSIAYLKKLTSDMTTEYGKTTTNKGIIYTPQIGMPCAAPYDDGIWYRGRIIKLLGKRKIEVFFVDFGDKRVYEYNQIRRLHNKYMSVTALAFKVSLKDVAPLQNNEWNTETIQFLNILYDQSLKIFVFSKENDSYKVTLYILQEDKDVNFNAVLAKARHAVSVGPSSQFVDIPKSNEKKRKKKRNKNKESQVSNKTGEPNITNELEESDPFRMQVNVLQVVSPDCIYVSDVGSEKYIKKMTEELQDFYNTYKSAESEDWKKDDVCVAYSAKDKLYHRSKIVEIISPEKVVVFLYDIGITETVTTQDLQSLNPKFSTTPARAFKIKLAGILPCGGSNTWVSSSCEALTDLINEHRHSKFYISKTAGIKDDAISVDLWVKEMRIEDALAPMIIEINSINRELVKKGVALTDRKYKDDPNKVLAIDLRQQLQENGKNNISNEVEWLMKNPESSNCSDVRSNSSVFEVGSSALKGEENDDDSLICGSSIHTFDLGSTSKEESDESEEEIPLPPPLSAWIPAVPISTDKFSAMSTYVDQNCTVYLHSQVENGNTLALIDAVLQAQYNGSVARACDMVWTPNEICIAQYHNDKKWYRAQVVEVTENNPVKVIFVDYGNTEDCEPHNLRKRVIMGHIPIQATKCVIQGLLPDSPDGKWYTEDLDTVHALLVDKINDITVLERKPDHLVISVILRTPKVMDICLFLRCELNRQVRELELNVDQKQFDIDDSETNDLDSADVLIEESIEDYVCDKITHLMFNPYSKQQSISETEEKVEKSNEVTTGSNDALALDPLNWDAILKINQNSDSTIELDDEAIQFMDLDSSEEYFAVTSTPQNEEEDDNCFMNYREFCIPDDIEIIDIEPLHIETPTTFCGQLHTSFKIEALDSYQKQLKCIAEEMQTEALKLPVLEDPSLYAPCIAKFTEDDTWYRAMITEIKPESEQVKVRYVDYGNSEYQPIDKIRTVKNEWIAVPVVALQYRLWKIHVNPDTSLKILSQRLECMLYRGTFKAKIKERCDQFIDVELYSDQDCTQLLYDRLLEDGLFKKTEQ